MRIIQEDVLCPIIIRRNVISVRKMKATLNEPIMDFKDVESDCSSSNVFSVSHIRENRFSQDTQHRPRKSPRKKLKVIRTSASLVIDQLKSGFRRPGDFTPRMRTRRNWRPEFLIKYFRDNRCGCKDERIVATQHDKIRRDFVPQTPKIYSIGLHSDPRSFSDSNDLSRSSCVIRNFKKRFNFIRRPMICKYWDAQSTPTSSLSPDVSLKAHTIHQAMVIDHKESKNIFKHDRIQKNNQNNNSHHNQSYEHTEEKDDVSDSLRHDHASGDRSFIADNFNHSSVEKGHNSSRSTVSRKDAQIQTLSRKSSRRKRRKRSKHRDDESRESLVTDFRTGLRNSDKRNYYEKSRLSVRALENKHAEYINKFMAVNRQIEEITTTLRETCYSSENSQVNVGKCEKYFLPTLDDTKANTRENLKDIRKKFTIARKNTLKEKDSSVNVKKIIRKSENDRRKNMREILYTDNINNNESSTNPDKNLDDIFVHDSIRTFTIKETVPSNRTLNKEETKYRFVKRISFDLNLTKDDDKLQEFSIEDKVRFTNNFEKKMGELAVLEDIKKRIDRDFDDPSTEKSENDTEDFLTIFQESSNFDRQFYEAASMEEIKSVKMIEESKSTSLIASGSPNPDSTEIQICDSISASAISEHSNKNSTLSKYFSCTQFPSLISLMENEDNSALENQNTIAHDSYSNSPSTSHYYDLDFTSNIDSSNFNENNCLHSNLNSSLDRLHSSLEYTAQYDAATQYISSPKFLIETINESSDTFEISEGRESFVEDKIREREYLLRTNKKEEKKSCGVLEKRYTADSTLETSKSSRYIGSIDSGVFSSSLIDLYPPENSFDTGKSELKEEHRPEKLDGSSTFDFTSDSSYTDDMLDRKVDDVVRDLTKNLILCERRAKVKLKEMQKAGLNPKDACYSRNIPSRVCKFSSSLCDATTSTYNFFNSPRSEDERILSISTPSLLSLSDFEIEDRVLDVNYD